MYISLDAILRGDNHYQACKPSPQQLQDRQSDSWPPSDIPGQNGAMSDAIKMRLREVGLADLEPLLRHRGITTMYALDHLSSKEASIIGQKAKQIYEIYDVSQDKLTKSLEQLFGSYDIATTECSEIAMPSVLKPLQGDTALKQMLGQALLQSRSLVGEENFDNCLRRLTKSQELAEASAMEAAEAFAAFIKDVPTFAPTLKNRRPPKTDCEALHLASALWKDEVVEGGKSGLRSMLLWRCAGWKLGLDEREALDRAFDEACKHCECGKEILTQMGNCWRKIWAEQSAKIAAKEVLFSFCKMHIA